MKHLVVALHNEDPQWINDVPDHWDIFVYHKGDQTLNLPKAKIIKLPNFGRESHSYLTHIIQHYDTLADLTAFCQGKYDDHCPRLMDYMEKNSIHEMPKNNQLYMPDRGYVALGAIWLHDAKTVDLTRPYATKFWLRAFGNVACPRYTLASWGHQFIATSQLLKKFSREWYEQILKDHENPVYFRNIPTTPDVLSSTVPYVLEQYLPEIYLNLNLQKEVVCKLFA